MTRLLPELVSVASIAPIADLQLKCLTAVQKVAFFTPSMGLSRRGASSLAACLHMLLAQGCNAPSHYAVATAALRVVGMIMQRLPRQFGPLFAREGITWRVYHLAGRPNAPAAATAAAGRRGAEDDSSPQDASSRKRRRSTRLRRGATAPPMSSPTLPSASRPTRGARTTNRPLSRRRTRRSVKSECARLTSVSPTGFTVRQLAALVWRELLQAQYSPATNKPPISHAMLATASPHIARMSQVVSRLRLGAHSIGGRQAARQDARHKASQLLAFMRRDLVWLRGLVRKEQVTSFEFVELSVADALLRLLRHQQLQRVFADVFSAPADAEAIVSLVQVRVCVCACVRVCVCVCMRPQGAQGAHTTRWWMFVLQWPVAVRS